MNTLEKFLLNNDLQDSDNIDSLLELSSFVRQLIDDKQYIDISTIINYLISHSYYEAFSWTMEVLDESLLEGIEVIIGKSIPDYDEFVDRLQVDFNVSETGCETISDENGEVNSFNNISIYQTRYQNILLVSSENFDNKDNDFIQYTLVFTPNKKDL